MKILGPKSALKKWEKKFKNDSFEGVKTKGSPLSFPNFMNQIHQIG